MILYCKFAKREIDIEKGRFFFNYRTEGINSKIYLNDESKDEKVLLNRMTEEIIDEITYMPMYKTGWYFYEVIRLEIHTVDYKAIKGYSYIPLPEFIMRKKAIINMENKDDKCFLWSVLRYLHPVKKMEQE